MALGPAIDYGPVPRNDVEGVIAAILFHAEITRVCLELTKGERSISEAVAAVLPRHAEL